MVSFMKQNRFNFCISKAIPLIFYFLLVGGAIFLNHCGYMDKMIQGFAGPPELTMKGLGPDSPGGRFSHDRYGRLLKKYVKKGGMVLYGRLESEKSALNEYIDTLASVDIKTLSLYEQLAFLINAYNACTLKLILENPGISSIKDISTGKRWQDKRWLIGKRKVSLGDIEHGWIRKEYGEPKIHFALVCAALGCPKLRNEPYTGAALVAQLNDQTADFFRSAKKFRWERDKNRIYISKLIKWYRHDFVSLRGSLVKFILPHLDPSIALEIKAARKMLKYTFISYDWKLNGTWK